MSRLGPNRRARFVAAAAALAIAIVLPAAVSADTTNPPPTIFPAQSRDATISVRATATVTARLIATVHVEFTCAPFESFDWETGEMIASTEGQIEFSSVEVLQVAGKTINFGTSEGFGGPADCDGTSVNAFDAPVTAMVVPWKSGTAIVGARVHVVDASFGDSDFASSGPVQVKLTK